MLIGEAPGRLGAARTGVPFAGDRSGAHLDALLDAAGWSRSDLYITNAVLCQPADDRGRNRRPSRAEIRRCGRWLREQLALVDPLVVVALGWTALDALGAIEPHDLMLARDIGRPIAWSGRWLVALYHPSARACIHRPLPRQAEDFLRLRRFVDGLAGRPTPDPA